MEITHDKVGPVSLVTLQADTLDASNASDFKRAMLAIIGPKAKVVLDLSPVNFVDSTGLGSILACLRQVTAAGGDLKLCALTEPVQMLFHVVRFPTIFDIFKTKEEAIGAFQG